MEDTKAVVKKIRAEYDEPKKEVSKLDTLKNLDKKVKNPAIITAYVFGIIGALVLGVGMCLAKQILAKGTVWLVLGIVVGILGIVMISLTYTLHNRILSVRRRQYSKEIVALSNELLNK